MKKWKKMIEVSPIVQVLTGNQEVCVCVKKYIAHNIMVTLFLITDSLSLCASYS